MGSKNFNGFNAIAVAIAGLIGTVAYKVFCAKNIKAELRFKDFSGKIETDNTKRISKNEYQSSNKRLK